MKKKVLSRVCRILGIVLFFCAETAAIEPAFAARPAVQPLVLVHYLPWYQYPPIQGIFNHWTQNSPKFDLSGVPGKKLNIASYFYPLIGPYGSRNDNVLEFQAALFKMAGVDGVIFDWYGASGAFDYGAINEATIKAVSVFKKAGLKFVVCYEDQTIKNRIDHAGLNPSNAVAEAKKDFDWLQKNFFADSAYVKENGHPVVLCFGPQYFKDKNQWDQIFSSVNPTPLFVTENGEAGAWEDAVFNWPWPDTASSKLNKGWTEYFYSQHVNKSFLIATAYSFFDDGIIVETGGYSQTRRIIEDGKGETFTWTLDIAKANNPNILQIATWNDYGEGTIVEPTIERGYDDLTRLQDFVKNSWKNALPFTRNDLSAPIELFKIMADKNAPAGKKALAKEAYAAIFAGDKATFDKKIAEVGIYFDGTVKPYLPGVLRQSQPDGNSGGGGGGGGSCNTGFLGVMLLLFVGIVIRRWVSRQE